MDTEEVLATFRYQAVGHVFVTTLYDYNTDKVYLPVAELFSLLMINMEIDRGNFSIRGFFIEEDIPYEIIFDEFLIAYDGTSSPSHKRYGPEHFIITETDYFLSPELFSKVFGLHFTPDIFALTLSLETQLRVPIVEYEQRLLARARIDQMQAGREFYPLLYPQRRHVLNLGFLDYNIASAGDFEQQAVTFNFDGGIAILGGAMRGSLNGSYRDGELNSGFSNLSWEYARAESRILTRADAGEIRSGGLRSRNIRGVSLTNEPLEARYFFGTIRQDGTTEPDATVELYMNNQLVQFTQADANGYYKFDIPLNYGQTRLEELIYFNDGRIERRNLRIPTPFNFQPPGALTYNIDGGYQVRGADLMGGDRLMVGSARLAYGVTKWLTARVGTDYVEDTDPFFYGGLSARLFSQYLFNADIAPEAYYQGSLAVVYPNSVSINTTHRHYDGASVFNTRDLRDESSLSLGLPVRPLPLRLQLRSQNYNAGFTEYDFGANTNYRLLGSNLQLQYRTRIFDRQDNGLEFSNQSLRSSLSYGVRRGSGLGNFMGFLTGTSLRVSTSYDVDIREFRDLDVQVTRRILGDGNLQFGMGHSFLGNRTLYRLSINFRLNNKVAITTSHTQQRDRYSTRNAIRGSFGIDARSRYIQPTFRNQVGRSAASVILFVDKNGSGTFDEGDEILPYNAIRLSGSGRGDIGSDGIVRLTQLQSNTRYNLEVVERMIPNATYVPVQNKFSFIADPNNYKRIEIPFYMSGVLEGVALVENQDGSFRGQGGMRLTVTGLDNSFRESLRTFNSGDFFLMNIPPGRYRLEASSAQLDLLGLVPGGDFEFEIRALPDGDYVSGMDLKFVRAPEEEEVERAIIAGALEIDFPTLAVIREVLEPEILEDTLFEEKVEDALRFFSRSQQLFFTGDLSGALENVRRSLSIFQTGHAFALKGNILYVRGREEEAQRFWEAANEIKDFIFIPDIEELDRLIRQFPEE